ncbi:MAG: hypothetical protein IPJ77_07760 [Planctomycetes bacterium]|nr:hypothetical protein [Planctomycetota bacterium]
MRRRLPLLALLLALGSTSCRAIEIKKLEDRQRELEARVAKLEGQVELLSRK